MLKSKGREHHKTRLPGMKDVKHFSKRKNRQQTRQLLHHKQFDKIPKDKPAATEDPWGWV